MSLHDLDVYNGAIKGLSEDFGRQKLAEDWEDNVWSSFERLRKRHNSVLTEDTDSFIIGDKVWVGGTKPGQIAYIGETQFAPGDWAGIVLDAPIGKNDGSVGGNRYFQCEPKRGVFSRLTRLTRSPLPGADESFTLTSNVYHRPSTPLNNGTRPRGASPLSPTGSTKSLRKSPSLSTSNTSLASTTHVIDFKVGDRVIVKSSQGSKVGTLRYMGMTSFAPGEWCGVELDEPRGKNDGSVEGLRYFQCKPQFGLFAPVTKVSKSPLKYKPGNCVLHSGAKLPPSGIKRAGSKESMTSFTSMTSSLASATSGARRVRLGVNSLTPQKVAPKSTVSNYPTRTALQDVLREKQLHIEQLLKERDLERAEITKAANQADNAEQQLITLQAEYEQHRAECEAKLKEYSTVLSHLNVDRGSLLSQLEDEKRKNEDLQFRFEEAAITKGDIEVSNQSNIHRIKDLEERLAVERQKVELLEQDSGKLFEAEEELVKSREEIDSLKSDLQHLRSKREAFQESSISNEASSVITQTQTKNIKIESTNSNEMTLGIRRSLSQDLEKQLEETKKESAEHFKNCENYKNEITTLKTELAQNKALLQEQTASMESRLKTNTEFESSLRAELERLKSELESKNAELQSKDEELRTKDDEIRSLKTLYETTEIELKAKTVDVQRYQKSKYESEDSYNKEIEYLKKILKEKVTQKEEIEKTSTIEITKQKSKLEDASRTIALNVEEIKKLTSELNEVKSDLERNSLDVHERHTRQIAIKESELMSMAAELQQKNEEISKCSIVTTKLEDDICVKNGIIEKLKLELESLKKSSESEQRSMLNYTERISGLQLTVGDLERKLASTEQLVLELQEQKARLEKELQNVIASAGDYSSELQKLNAAVIEKELMITTVRNELLQKLQMQQSNEQQLQLQLQKLNEDSERIQNNLKERLRISQESEEMLRQRCESTNAEAIKVRDDLMIKVNQLQRLVEEKEFALKVSLGDHTESKRYLQEQLDRTTAELQKTIDNCQFKINELSAENINAKNTLAQKTQELIEAEAKLKHFVTQSQLNEEELRRLTGEQTKSLQFDLSEKNAQIQQFLTELELLKRDCHSRNTDIAEKDHRISELSVQLENTLKLIQQLQIEKDNLQLAQMEANKECVIRNQQCTDLLNQVAILSEKVDLGEKAAQELLLQKTLHERLIQQLQITEQQKHSLIARLQEEARKNGDVEKCQNMLELAKNIQTSINNEHTQKILELQQTIETTQQQLEESQKQLETQKGEILSLQNELISTQQSCEQRGIPSNSVSNLNGDKQTQYPLQYPAFLQVQLTNLKNSYVELLKKFVGSQQLNAHLINKLERAVSNGDTQHIQTLLNELHNLKQYMNTLRGTVEQDKFKFQKIISYALLSLHKKQIEVNVQNNYIKQLQNAYNSLPIQCKLLQPSTLNYNSELPNEAQIELEKTIQLIRAKDEHIQNLKTQLVSVQESCKKLFNAKCPVTPSNERQLFEGILQYVPYCGPSKVLFRKVPVIQYVPQPCQQQYPDYVLNQPIVDKPSQNCAPVIQKVPVYVPRIVVKEVPRYVNENFKCPTPQVVYQKVPIPLPPKVVVVPQPVPTADTIPQQNQITLSQCDQYCNEKNSGGFWAPPINSGSLVKRPDDNLILKQQIQNLMLQLRECRAQSFSLPPSTDTYPGSDVCAQTLRNKDLEINALKAALWSCNRPSINNQKSQVPYLLSIIENLKKSCSASGINSPVSGEYTSCSYITFQHNTLFNNLRSMALDILRGINVNYQPAAAKATIAAEKLNLLLTQLNKDISPQDYQDAQCWNIINQRKNQLDILRNIIHSSLPQLNIVQSSPVAYLNLLRKIINEFLSQLNVDSDTNSSDSLVNLTKCTNALTQNQMQLNALRGILQGILTQLNNGQVPDTAKLNLIKQNLLQQLNNKGDINTPGAGMPIQELIRELYLCRASKTAPSNINNWMPGVDFPGYPGWSGLQQFNNTGDINNIPGAGFPNIPGYPGWPDFSQLINDNWIPKAPGTGFPYIPGYPGWPGFQELNKKGDIIDWMPNTPEATIPFPGYPGWPSLPNTQGSGFPNIPGYPDLPGVINNWMPNTGWQPFNNKGDVNNWMPEAGFPNIPMLFPGYPGWPYFQPFNNKGEIINTPGAGFPNIHGYPGWPNSTGDINNWMPNTPNVPGYPSWPNNNNWIPNRPGANIPLLFPGYPGWQQFNKNAPGTDIPGYPIWPGFPQFNNKGENNFLPNAPGPGFPNIAGYPGWPNSNNWMPNAPGTSFSNIPGYPNWQQFNNNWMPIAPGYPRWSDYPNKGDSNNWMPNAPGTVFPNIPGYPADFSKPKNTFTPEAIELENIYLKNKIQELLLQLRILNEQCRTGLLQNEIQDRPPFYDCFVKDTEINQLKSEIDSLTEQLNNFNANRGASSPWDLFNGQCPPPRVVVQEVPSSEQQNEIDILKAQVQNLLLQLRLNRFPAGVPKPLPWTVPSPDLVPQFPSQPGYFNSQYPQPKVTLQTVPEQENQLINMLKSQIDKLTQELNNARMYPGSNVDHPKVIVQKVPVPILPSQQQQDQILNLKSQIQNLLNELQLYKSNLQPQLPWRVNAPTSSSDSVEIDKLKLQINKLIQELNLARLNNQCLYPSTGFNTQLPPFINQSPYPSIGFNSQLPPWSDRGPYPSTGFNSQFLPFSNQGPYPSTGFNSHLPQLNNQSFYPSTSFNSQLPPFNNQGPYPSIQMSPLNNLGPYLSQFPPLNDQGLYPTTGFNSQLPPFNNQGPYPSTGFDSQFPPFSGQGLYPSTDFNSQFSPLNNQGPYPSTGFNSPFSPLNNQGPYPPQVPPFNYPGLYPSTNYPPSIGFVPGIPSPEQQNEINILKNQIQNLLTQLRLSKLHPENDLPFIDSNQINSLKFKIQELTQELNYVKSHPQCPLYPPTRIVSPDQENEIINLKNQIQNLLMELQFYKSQPSPTPFAFDEKYPTPPPSDSLLNGNVQCSPPRVVVTRIPIPVRIPILPYQPNVNNQEVIYLRRQIQQLLTELNVLQNRPISQPEQKFVVVPSSEERNLRQEILRLQQQLNLANRQPLIYNNRPCVPSKESLELRNEVFVLRQRVKNLLVELENARLYPLPATPIPAKTIIQPGPIRTVIQPVPQPVPVVQPFPEQEAEINALKIQIQQLLTELNEARKYQNIPSGANQEEINLLKMQIQNLLIELENARLYPKCTNQFEKPPYAVPSDNEFPMQPCPPPKIIVRPVPIFRTSPEQQQEVMILKSQVQNLLQELNIANQYKYGQQCPETKVLTERVPVYVPSPSNNNGEIEFLKQQIRNLLVQLNSRSNIFERPETKNVVPSPSQQYEIEILKNQIQNLVRQINNLQNECFNQRQPFVIPPDFSQPCPRPIIKHVPIIQPAKTVIKEVKVPVSPNCDIPKVVVHNVPVPQPPRIIIKEVPVVQPPKIVIKEIPIPIGSSCPSPEVVVQKVPIFQPARTILKEVPIVQPPRIIIKEVPVPQAPEIKIKYVPMPVPENKNCVAPKVIVQKVPVPQPARTIIKEVPTSRPPQIVIKEVPIPQPPKVIVKKVPVFHNELCQQKVPQTVIKEIPIPVSSQSANECNVPKYIIQQVPVVQPPKIIIKNVPSEVPPREIIKTVPVPIIEGAKCPPPQIIQQRVPVVQIKTVVKEVPIAQPPRIIIKQVPVTQPPQVILKKILVPVGENIQCPAPQVIVEKVEVPQPPRIIIKQVPVILPPRIVVQQVPKYIYNSDANNNVDSPEALIKEIVVPTDIRRECPVPQVLIHNVPTNQPPKIIVKNVPVVLPPKIVIKKIPVGPNVNCRVPEVIVKPVPVIQPSRTVLKEVPLPPKIVIKEVPVIQPQVQVKYVPVPVAQNQECPKPQVIVQKVLVPQPPRTIITEVPRTQPPRVVIKEVLVPGPPRVIVKEIPIVSNGLFGSGSLKNGQEVRTLQLQNMDLVNRLEACSKSLYPSETDNWWPVQSLPQCLHQVQKQKTMINKLNYKLRYIVCKKKNIPLNKFNGMWGGINKDFVNSPGSGKYLFDIPSLVDESTRIQLPLSQNPQNLPLPMWNLLKPNTPSIVKYKNGLQTLFTKVLHEAFTYTQKALGKCMNAVFIQQLATQTDNNEPGWGGDRQLIEEKEMAEGQIQFLNSIIVDMQRKSQEQQARIQLLESGYSPSAADELKLYGLSQAQGHQRPPRVYCDICELFDDHETEDCPLQTTDFDGFNAPSRSTRTAASNRSYCEICEIFGHCTEDCKEDQTF